MLQGTRKEKVPKERHDLEELPLTLSHLCPMHTSSWSVFRPAPHGITVIGQGSLEEVLDFGQDHTGSSEEGWYLRLTSHSSILLNSFYSLLTAVPPPLLGTPLNCSQNHSSPKPLHPSQKPVYLLTSETSSVIIAKLNFAIKTKLVTLFLVLGIAKL